jgi:hypothetical protein
MDEKRQYRTHGGKDVPHGLLVKIIRYDLKMKPKDFFFAK